MLRYVLDKRTMTFPQLPSALHFPPTFVKYQIGNICNLSTNILQLNYNTRTYAARRYGSDIGYLLRVKHMSADMEDTWTKNGADEHAAENLEFLNLESCDSLSLYKVESQILDLYDQLDELRLETAIFEAQSKLPFGTKLLGTCGKRG